MLFYDIEVFKYYWCVVAIDDVAETRTVLEDIESLRSFYKANRHQTWVGYNSRQYDAPMLRFIMMGLDPYECSQDLIVRGLKYYQIGNYVAKEMYNRIPLKNFDCVLLNKGLKKLEAFRGSSIIECDIPWDIDRPLTREEKDRVIAYCTHDVVEMSKVFFDTIEEYNAHELLVSTFNLNPIHFNKTKAQLSALILGAEKKHWYDEWKFEIADTLRLDKYDHIRQWYLDPMNHNYDAKLEIDVAGVPHTFAWGGLHGARLSYSGEGVYINMDVESYYPAMMIEYNYLSRNVLDPKKYKEMRDYRVVLKKNKDPRQLPYKIVLNGTYGAMKDKYNNLYDPRQANSVCVTGQLLLLDLIEKLEDYCMLIQSNTDGILVKLHNGTQEEYDKVVEISAAWSARTRMKLEYDKVVKVFQKDVNNYVTVFDKGDSKVEWKSKGAFVKEWLRKDENKNLVPNYIEYDLPIVREALINQLVYNIPIEKTIHECTELRKFQKIVMVSSKFKYAFHGFYNKKTKALGEYTILAEKHLRVFASTNESDGGIYKVKVANNSVNQVGDTPDHSFIVNGDITNACTIDYPMLDKQYYIDLANKRIKNFYNKSA